MTIIDEIKSILKVMPDLTVHDLAELLPDIKKQTIYATVSRAYQLGELVITGQSPIVHENGKTMNNSRYAVSDNPVPLTPQRKMDSPTPVGYTAQINALKKQIAEMEQWKADALQRYPDLAVAPIVLRARKIVASELASSDPALAEQVRRGQKDTSLMMRVTITALEEGE